MGYPSGTTLRFLLLVAMTALASSFVGDWMFLSTAEPFDVTPSWAWLVLPPVLVLLVAAGLALAAPRWLERHRGWVALPPDTGAVARRRFDDLVSEAGLSRRPTLVWDAEEEGARALTYGRPSRYRVVVSPSLVGASRRHPAAFDAVVRHELAHVRHRDVAPAYFAILVWYVLVAVLVVPLLWRLVDRDFSLVPEYLVRVGLLAVAVYWVRADLLRVREHYADVRAADTEDRRQALLGTLGTPALSSRARRVFSLHPTTGSRIRVITDPALLGQPGLGELFAAGLTATYAVPLLGELLFYAGMSAMTAPRVAHVLLFGLVGMYVGAASARWAGAGAHPRPLARALAGLALGLTLGGPLSLGATGLVPYAPAELRASVLTALVVAGYFGWSADFARVVTVAAGGRPRLVATMAIVVVGVVVALVADTIQPVVELIRLDAGGPALHNPFAALASTRGTAVLAWCVPLLGLATLVAGGERRRRAGSTLATAGILGASAVLVSLLIRVQVDLQEADGSLGRYSLVQAWVAVGAATLAACWSAGGRGVGRLTGGFLACGLTALIAWTGSVLGQGLWFEHVWSARDALSAGSTVVAVALIVGALPAALLWLVADQIGVSERARVLRVTTSAIVLVVLAGGAVALVPPLVVDTSVAPVEPSTSEAALREYLDQEVEPILSLQEQAAADFLSALQLPAGEAAASVREDVLPQYDRMLAMIDGQELSEPESVEVQQALRTWLAAERLSDLAYADTLDGHGRDHPNALADADQAQLRWWSIYDEARARADGAG